MKTTRAMGRLSWFLATGAIFAVAGASGCSSGNSTTQPPPGNDSGTPQDSGTVHDSGNNNPMDSGNNNPMDSGNNNPMDSGSGNDAGGACNLVAQTGCTTGQECTLSQAGAAVCEPNGTIASGQACGQNIGNCSAGSLCIQDSQTATTDLCHQFCSTDANCTAAAVPAGSTAEPNNVGHCALGLTGTSATVCTIPCNPVTAAGASGCPTGTGCQFGGTQTIAELTNCGTVGTGTDGTVCADDTTCAGGFFCLITSADAGATGLCREVCRATTNTDCSGSGYTCVSPGGVTNPMFGLCCPAAGC